MKKTVYCVVLLLCLSLLLSGCGKEEETPVVTDGTPAISGTAEPLSTVAPSPAPTATVSPTSVVTPTATPSSTVQPTPKPKASSIASPTASPTATPQPDEYYIDGFSIYKRSGREDILVYAVTPYFPSGWNCHLSNLMVYEGNVYFTEGGMPGDDYSESLHRIICLNSMGRTVIYESEVCGYDQIIYYGNRIFFVIGEFDSAQIGWANQDGSDGGLLNFVDYSEHYGVEPVYNYAELYVKDGVLYADIGFYTGNYWPDEIALHMVRIGEDLSIARVEDV